MSTDYLGLFASRNNFKYHKSRIFGTYNGYDMCVGTNGDMLMCFIATQVTEINSFIAIMDTNGIQKGIVSYRIAPPLLAVYAQNHDIKQVLDFVTELLTLCKSSTYELCPFCNERLKEEDRVYFTVDDVVCVGHDKCIDNFTEVLNGRAERLVAQQKPSYKLLPIVIIAAIVCAIALSLLCMYFTVYGEYLFVGGGFAVGYFLCAIYRKNNGRGGVGMYVTVTVASFISLFVAQIMFRGYVISINTSVAFLAGVRAIFTDIVNLWKFALPAVGIAFIIAVIAILIYDVPIARLERSAKIRITKL